MSWKITYLKLKNFIQIYTGMDRYEVEIDWKNNSNKINIFVGKMGSGKSSILGHLQPFSTYGTLDIRNQESSIIPEEDGLKEIIFVNGTDTYEISHWYTWNKSSKSHSTKSFISLNGEELNKNGNVRSFKELIKLHFGIDQNFLRLLRLGPNVANLINMKSTERKAFISTLLKDTEVYLMLHQKLTEDYRNLNSALGLLNAKLQAYDSVTVEKLENTLENSLIDAKVLTEEITDLEVSLGILANDSLRLLENKSIDEYELAIRKIENTIHSIEKDLRDTLDTLIPLSEDKTTIEQYLNQMGEYSGRVSIIESEIISLELELNKEQTAIDKLNNEIIVQTNSTQLDHLRSSVDSISVEYETTKLKLAGFTCSYGYTYLQSFNDSIQHFQLLLNDLCSYSPELLVKLYRLSPEGLSIIKKKLPILEATKAKKQKEINNINYALQYNSPEGLERGKNCKDLKCAYYTSHPDTIKKANAGIENKELNSRKADIEKIDIEVSQLCDIVGNYQRMQLLKKSWSNISTVLNSVGALNEKSLFDILTIFSARNNWYDYNVYIHTVEKCKIKETFDELHTRYTQMVSDLKVAEATGVDGLRRELEIATESYNTKLGKLESHIQAKNELLHKKEITLEIIQRLEQRDTIEAKYDSLIVERNSYNKTLVGMKENRTIVLDNLQKRKALSFKLREESEKYSRLQTIISNIQSQLSEIKSNTDSYNEHIVERDILKMIVDAVSSKDGIPLILIKVFLDDCREIVNDLISHIFDDDLEVLDFQISEETNEFKIPFASNGVQISDIEYASQGQQAVISLALSFALCRKSMFDYNIMLLDEIDNSIYKSDREKFIEVLFRQMVAMNTQQVFLITHNDIFQQSGLPINILATSAGVIDSGKNQKIVELF